MKDAPCKNCDVRYPACHSDCPKDRCAGYEYYGYQAWLKDVRQAQAAEKEWKLQRREEFIRGEECGWINGRRKY